MQYKVACNSKMYLYRLAKFSRYKEFIVTISYHGYLTRYSLILEVKKKFQINKYFIKNGCTNFIACILKLRSAVPNFLFQHCQEVSEL